MSFAVMLNQIQLPTWMQEDERTRNRKLRIEECYKVISKAKKPLCLEEIHKKVRCNKDTLRKEYLPELVLQNRITRHQKEGCMRNQVTWSAR